jgi:hypothetical protein
VAGGQNYRSFLGIYEFVRTACSASSAATRPRLDALDELQDELETILRGVVIGLRNGTISSDGLDTFKLGYEFVRDEIGLRREDLKRHPPSQDDKVVAVKTAQSA